MTADDKDDESVTDKVCCLEKKDAGIVQHSMAWYGLVCYGVLTHGMVHFLIIIREVLILTLSTFIALQALQCWGVFLDYYQEILPKGQYFLIHSLGQLSGTRAENIDTEGTMKTLAGK